MRATLPAEQIKSGNAQTSAALATELISSQRSLEIRVLGFALLEHLVRELGNGRLLLVLALAGVLRAGGHLWFRPRGCAALT